MRLRRGPVRPGRNFTVQTYLYLSSCIVFATVLLSGLLFHFQQQMLRRHMVETGNSVVSFLAESLRIGLFAENAEEIRAAVLPVLQDSQVVGVGVFNPRRELLQSAQSATADQASGRKLAFSAPASLLDAVQRTGGPAHADEGERVVFWKAVRTDPGKATTEGLYFFDGPLARQGASELLGYVAVAVSKGRLRAGLRAIVERSVAAGLVFLLLGSVVTYLVVRGASRPLHGLVAEVRKRGFAAANEGDLGLLSDTFSELVETLDNAFFTIDELRLGLEQKVEERTAELSESNRELQAEVFERQRVQEELKKARDELEARVAERTAELEAAYKRLLHSEKLSALGTLTASIAHEFNNPLFAIRGVLENLQFADRLGESELRMIGLAIQECDRISRLIHGLQDFYRPSTGTVTELDVHETIESVLMLCRKDFWVREIQVETRYGEGVPRIHAVEDQIKQVILNLLNNARDAMGEKGGTIEIATELRDGRVRIQVEDTGAGIAERDLDQIFAPFFSTKTESRGTGLGLSISRGIVQRHGGEIEVTSRVGEGTRFTVVLPTDRKAVKATDQVVDS